MFWPYFDKSVYFGQNQDLEGKFLQRNGSFLRTGLVYTIFLRNGDFTRFSSISTLFLNFTLFIQIHQYLLILTILLIFIKITSFAQFPSFSRFLSNIGHFVVGGDFHELTVFPRKTAK